jgi:hypothetical protein
LFILGANFYGQSGLNPLLTNDKIKTITNNIFSTFNIKSINFIKLIPGGCHNLILIKG